MARLKKPKGFRQPICESKGEKQWLLQQKRILWKSASPPGAWQCSRKKFWGSRIQFNFWKRAAAGPNVKILATALFTFSKEVASLDDAFDLIDECRTEGKTIYELYEELIQEANGGGFFKKIYNRRGAEGGNESTGARSGTDCELCGEYYGEGCNNWRGLIAAIRPEAYKCGVKPLEFQEMSLFEVHEYIEAYHERQKDKFRYEAILLSGLASQVINAFSQQPKKFDAQKDVSRTL